MCKNESEQPSFQKSDFFFMEKDQMSVCPQGGIQVEMVQSPGLKATRNKCKMFGFTRQKIYHF